MFDIVVEVITCMSWWCEREDMNDDEYRTLRVSHQPQTNVRCSLRFLLLLNRDSSFVGFLSKSSQSIVYSLSMKANRTSPLEDTCPFYNTFYILAFVIIRRRESSFALRLYVVHCVASQLRTANVSRTVSVTMVTTTESAKNTVRKETKKLHRR